MRLLFKKVVYVIEKVESLWDRLSGNEIKEQMIERKNKEFAEKLTKKLGETASLFLNSDNTLKKMYQSTFDTIDSEINNDVNKLETRNNELKLELKKEQENMSDNKIIKYVIEDEKKVEQAIKDKY